MLEDNEQKSRFELTKNGEVAYAEYRLDGSLLHIPYVYAPDALRGTGAAGELMRLVTDHARAKGLRINPICGYAAAWMRKHADTHDLLASR